jgi:TM2 domain-containing membrane protein YozV
MFCVSSTGFSRTTTVLLSIFFGGFGADRFYLGHIATGFVKLLTFGGCGIWSLVDVIFLFSGILNPRDGTLFLETVNDYHV